MTTTQRDIDLYQCHYQAGFRDGHAGEPSEWEYDTEGPERIRKVYELGYDAGIKQRLVDEADELMDRDCNKNTIVRPPIHGHDTFFCSACARDRLVSESTVIGDRRICTVCADKIDAYNEGYKAGWTARDNEGGFRR